MKTVSLVSMYTFYFYFYALDLRITCCADTSIVHTGLGALGHDVVIKSVPLSLNQKKKVPLIIEILCRIASDADQPTNEFKVLQYLSEEGIRSDPRNYILKFLTFYKLIFAVMPLSMFLLTALLIFSHL